MLSDDYEQEQADLRAKIEMLENEIQNQEDQAENVDRFIRQAKKYLYLEKLTPTILNDMVNAVYVHAPDQVQRTASAGCDHQLQLYRHTPRQFTL